MLTSRNVCQNLINFAKTSWLASICADRAYVVGRLRALLDGVTATIA